MVQSTLLAKAQGVAVTMVDVNERALDWLRKCQPKRVEAQIFLRLYEAVRGCFDHVINLIRQSELVRKSFTK